MKNKKYLLIGIFITIIFILFINGMLQYLFLNLLGITIKEVVFSTSGLTSVFSINAEDSNYFNSLVIFSKLLISVSFLELGLLLLSKFPIGAYRFVTITSILSLTGYLHLVQKRVMQYLKINE